MGFILRKSIGKLWRIEDIEFIIVQLLSTFTFIRQYLLFLLRLVAARHQSPTNILPWIYWWSAMPLKSDTKWKWYRKLIQFIESHTNHRRNYNRFFGISGSAANPAATHEFPNFSSHFHHFLSMIHAPPTNSFLCVFFYRNSRSQSVQKTNKPVRDNQITIRFSTTCKKNHTFVSPWKWIASETSTKYTFQLSKHMRNVRRIGIRWFDI